MNNLVRYAPIALAVLRIVTALLFIEHGTQKIFGFPPMQEFGAEGGGEGGNLYGEGWIATLMLVAGWIEVVGGLAVMLGLFTRPAAFILSGEMAVAYWLAHVSMGGFFPINNGGESAVLFCFLFLYLVFAGPGAWALDSMMGKREQVLA